MIVISTVALVSGAAGLAALLVMQEPRYVLLGFIPGVFYMLVHLRRRARGRSRGGRVPPAPPEAIREKTSATVRRVLTDWIWFYPAALLIVVILEVAFGPAPPYVAIVSGVPMGIAIGAGLEGLRQVAGLMRWQRAHHLVILLELPAADPVTTERPRAVYAAPHR